MPFQKILKELARELDRREIPYMVIGGQAVLIYGEPRLTRDIDITLGVSPEALKELLEVSKKLNLKVLVDDVEDFVNKTFVLPALHPSGIRVDFIFSYSFYEKEALNRAVSVTIENYPVKFASVEDLIIHKLVAGRPRDIEDVKNILIKRKVDINYIEKWLKEFSSVLNVDLISKFKEILKEAQDA